MKNKNIVLLLVTPLMISLIITVLMYCICKNLGTTSLGILSSSEDGVNTYKSICVDIIEYTNSAKIEITEELVGIYNLEAGNIDNWNGEIFYEEFQTFKDDFIYVNGDIASSEDFDDYLLYEFDNYKSIKVWKQDIGDNMYSEYTHKIPTDLQMVKETTDEKNGTITREYSNNMALVYQYREMLVSNEDTIKVVIVNLFSIFITYIVILAVEMALIYMHERKETSNEKL